VQSVYYGMLIALFYVMKKPMILLEKGLMRIWTDDILEEIF